MVLASALIFSGQSRVHDGGGVPLPTVTAAVVKELSKEFCSAVLLEIVAVLLRLLPAAPAVKLRIKVASALLGIDAIVQSEVPEPVHVNDGPEVCVTEFNVALVKVSSRK